ncbi:MAG: recombination protein NinG [Bacteroidota bacterium]
MGIKQTKPTYRKCKVCLSKFKIDPFKPFLPGCSYDCNVAYSKILLANKKAKEERDFTKQCRKDKKAFYDNNKTHSDYLADLQDVFNAFIRQRDKLLPCISCGTMNNVKYDAGHFYSRKGYSGIRFDEDNVHKQCSNNCNVHLSGNFAEYSIQLPKRIGQERFNALVERRHKELRLSIPEIKELIIEYKHKLKQL